MTDPIPHQTQGQTFFAPCGPAATPLFTVNPDIPLVDALAHSSNLQLVANQLMTDAAMGDDGPQEHEMTRKQAERVLNYVGSPFREDLIYYVGLCA